MIEKFNFYDIYGYFLPGLALLGVLWLPFGLVKRIWPANDWGSALIVLALAYILGHLMQYIALSVIPSHDVKGSRGKGRYPSETVLDPGNPELSAEVQTKLASAVKAEFGLDLHTDDGSGDHDRVRNNAFLLARQRLIREKAASYAEQFQGMYALTRGLIAALTVAAVYFAGWAFSVVRGRYSFLVAFVLMVLAMLVIVNSGCALLREKDARVGTDAERKRIREENQNRKANLELAYTVSLLTLFCLGGYLLGLRQDLRLDDCMLLAIFAVVAILGCLRCYGQYRYFAVRFATTVWRDFLAYSEKDKSAAVPWCT